MRISEKTYGSILQDTLVGEACAQFRNQLDISYPVNNGIIQNWDDMCHVWDHAFFSELKVISVSLCHEGLVNMSLISSDLLSVFLQSFAGRSYRM